MIKKLFITVNNIREKKMTAVFKTSVQFCVNDTNDN